MGIILVVALLFISYSCTCQLGLSQNGHGQAFNGPVIRSDEVLVVATGVNSLLVAWWPINATLVTRYSVFCSSLHAQVQINKTEGELSVKQFNESAINSLSVDNLVPRTTYNCCIAVYSIENSHSVCKMATTLSAASECQQGNTTSVNRTVGAAISLFVMLLITLLCTSILSLVAMRQRQDGKRIEKWVRTVIDQYHLESQHSLDNRYDCHNIEGSEHNEPDAIHCAAADNEPDALCCATADNEPDAVYCTTTDIIVSVVEEEFPLSDHSIETTECVAYHTNESEDPNAPEDSNESDMCNSGIYESIS